MLLDYVMSFPCQSAPQITVPDIVLRKFLRIAKRPFDQFWKTGEFNLQNAYVASEVFAEGGRSARSRPLSVLGATVLTDSHH